MQAAATVLPTSSQEHKSSSLDVTGLFSRYVQQFNNNPLRSLKTEGDVVKAEPESRSQPQPQPKPQPKRKRVPKCVLKKPFHFQIRYTADQKRQIWELFKEYDVDTVFEMCQEKIPRGTLRDWQKKAIAGESAERKKGSGRKIRFPAIEERVFRWFLKRRAKQLPVTNMDLQDEGKRLAKELNVEGQFKASRGWVTKFRRRYNLKCRFRTRLATKSAREMRALIASHFVALNARIDKFQPADIWNFDEVRIYFEPNLSKTVERGCQKNVSIISVGALNMRMTVILLISASGYMAPPVLLFYNKSFQPFTLKEYPDALITSNRSAYNVESTHYEVVLPHFLKYIKEGSLVIYDECHAHSSARIANLLQSKNVNHLRIPGGATSLCQPVDFGIGRKVKYEVKRQFVKWLSTNFEEITTPKGRRRKSFQKPTNKMVAAWVLEGVKSVKSEEILHSFFYTGITSKEYQKTILDEKIPRFFVTTDRPGPDTLKTESHATPDSDSIPAPVPAPAPTPSPESASMPRPSPSSSPNFNPGTPAPIDAQAEGAQGSSDSRPTATSSPVPPATSTASADATSASAVVKPKLEPGQGSDLDSEYEFVPKVNKVIRKKGSNQHQSAVQPVDELIRQPKLEDDEEYQQPPFCIEKLAETNGEGLPNVNND